VANPMTADMEYLRTSLRSNLLAAFAANRRYDTGSIRLFEVGKIYLRKNNLAEGADERDTACGILGGQRFSKFWQNTDQVLDFYDARGLLEGLMGRLGLEFQFKKGQDAALHPNKQAEVYLKDQKVGVIGEVHPQVLTAFEIAEPVYLLEIDIKALIPFVISQKSYQPIPRFPSILRDLSLIVDLNITNQRIIDSIKGFPLVEQVEIFDVYSGGQVPAGKKSLAYRMTYRSPTHTLTDEEVDRVQQQILTRLNVDLKAELRG
jgi:phenylalanyl-tRNA synthetase beta chain